MMIRSATALRNDYDGMVKLSTEKQEPIYLTRNGDGEMVFLPIALWEKRQAALELFAAHGYDAVSVEQIAGAVGIKAPSLYNHFVSKRAIFDEIVSDAAARYEDFTAMQSVHVDDADADTGEFLGISEDVLCQKVREIFLYSLHDKTVSRLRKLLTIEQFRSAELSKMYNERYVDRLANYHAGLFAHLMEKGQIKQYDPYVLVLMYVSPIMTLMGVCDRQPEREDECLQKLDKHVRLFFNAFNK